MKGRPLATSQSRAVFSNAAAVAGQTISDSIPMSPTQGRLAFWHFGELGLRRTGIV